MPRSESPIATLSRHRNDDGKRDGSMRDDHKERRRKDREYEKSSRRYKDDDYSHHKDHSRSSRHHRDSERSSNHERRKEYSEDESEEERRRRRRKIREQEEEEYERERAERKRRHKERSSSSRKHHDPDGDDDKKAEIRAKAAETLLYTTEQDDKNVLNGPSNQSQSFTWAKKAEKERKMGMTPAEARKRDEERRREAEEEISRLNKKREEREREQVIREEEEARMARLAESAAMAEWVAKEDDFYLEQSRKRAVIRVKENRAKPIDLLAINLKWINPPSVDQSNQSQSSSNHPADQRRINKDDDDDDELELEVDLEEPYLLFDNLDLKETEELYQDIQMYLSLEKEEQNLDFWRSMVVVCDDRLANLKLAAGESTNEAGIRSRVDPSVKADMDKMLSNKSQQQLFDLQGKVKDKLQSQEPIDVEYWEGLMKSITVWRAKAKLRDLHEVILSNRIEHLRQRQRIEEERRLRLGLPSIEEERVAKAAEAARRRAEREAQNQFDDGSEDLFAKEASKVLEEDEEIFANKDEDLMQTGLGVGNNGNASATYSWQDKYRPRKPRYFNKVHTGFEWNKYNRTHYDHDNPPPKQVQGYKFNIFYPDLIDKSQPPTFKIIKEKGNDETCLIVFEAGPPYETIAFRIVNKPWNMSHNRGFKAVFERGVLQLYFNFQRMFYRK